MRYPNRSSTKTIFYYIFAAALCLIVVWFIWTVSENGNYSAGLNGILEQRCINGYAYVIDGTGNARQTLDSFGKGVRCN